MLVTAQALASTEERVYVAGQEVFRIAQRPLKLVRHFPGEYVGIDAPAPERFQNPYSCLIFISHN
jgi:hypothetical protein